MKRWEAERAAIEDGKKIRHREWDKGFIFYNKKKQKYENDYGIENNRFLIIEDGWEIYEEPKPKKKIKRFRVITKDALGNYDEVIVFGEIFPSPNFANQKLVRVDEETIEVDK